MLFLIWLVLCLLVVFLVLLPSAIWARAIYRRYAGWRQVACPENRQAALVHMDARHAAATGVHGHPDLRLCDCTRWPERAACERGCLAEAAGAEPYTADEVQVTGKRIYHLPIVLAGFAAWCLGAFWHAQYLFRPQWMAAAGLPRAEVKQIVWWYTPHVLSLAACLLFAYGVAWLLTVCHRKGVLPGVLMAVLLSGTVAAASWFGIARLPHELLMIEAGYVALAALTVGAIVGGLYDKLVLPRH